MIAAPRLSVDALSDTHTGGAIMWVGGDAIMAVVMVILVVSWLYRPGSREADRDGWGERARRATFQAHTGMTDDVDIDAGGDSAYGTDSTDGTDSADSANGADRARQAYNDWLANLAKR
jgi:putative copper resistance protein D